MHHDVCSGKLRTSEVPVLRKIVFHVVKDPKRPEEGWFVDGFSKPIANCQYRCDFDAGCERHKAVGSDPEIFLVNLPIEFFRAEVILENDRYAKLHNESSMVNRRLERSVLAKTWGKRDSINREPRTILSYPYRNLYANGLCWNSNPNLKRW